MKEIYTAIITPFNENNEVDYSSLNLLVKRFANEKQDGLIVLGTTAESACLSHDEKINIVLEVLKNKLDLKVIVGAGTNNTQETIDFVKELDRIKDIDGYLIVVPYYNKPTQEGLYQHYLNIARSTNRDIYIYNVPKRCGIAIEYQTVKRLILKCKNIVGIKHASNQLEMIELLKKEFPNFKIYSGEDGLLKEGLEVGIDGVISVISHKYYYEIRKLFNDYEQGKDIHDIDQKIKWITQLCFKEASPGPIKYLLSLDKECLNKLRLPLISISPLLMQQLQSHDEMLRLQNKDMLE